MIRPKRIGYIGLSTPIFYDREHKASQTQNDQSTSPNPVLDGAIGAMLLYDELWFLCRSLCPENMRNLSYVRFLDEDSKVPTLDVDTNEIEKFWKTFSNEARDEYSKFNVDYTETIRALDLSGGELYTATNNLLIDGFLTRGTSHNYAKLYMDVNAVSQFEDPVELLTNRTTSILLRTKPKAANLSQTAEALILENIIEYLDIEGPYHPFVDELRESPFLASFRAWIQNLNRNASAREIREVRKEVDTKIGESMQKFFIEMLDPSKIYKDAAGTIIETALDLIAPGGGAATSLAKSYIRDRDLEEMRWQGFIVDARRRTKFSPDANST